MDLKEVQSAIRMLLGDQYVGSAFDIFNKLNGVFANSKDTPSGYGYIKYLLENVGDTCRYSSTQKSSSQMTGYLQECTAQREILHEEMIRASGMMNNLLERSVGRMGVVSLLSNAVKPITLFVLYKWVHRNIPAYTWMEEESEACRKEASEYLRRYPSSINNLPEEFKAIATELRE